MNMRKRIRLTPHDRRSIWSRYQAGDIKVARLAAIYRVSRPTIYKILARARKDEYQKLHRPFQLTHALLTGLSERTIHLVRHQESGSLF